MRQTETDEMKRYYNQRAREYEKIYEKPERQDDVKLLKEELKQRFKDQTILEVACGTGYWTEVISETAKEVAASDQSFETLELAKAKNLKNAQFVQDDAYSLEQCHGNFTAGFAGFWWSHIPKSKQSDFLSKFHSKLTPGSKVVFVDNQYVEGSSTPLNRSDAEGNTYQMRKLSDGSSHEVLKNFPTDGDLKNSFSEYGQNLEIKRSKYYWLVEYRIPSM